MAKKCVFVAHPINGDIAGNMKKVLRICRMIHSKRIIPVAPYLVALQYLRDDVHEDRALGVMANNECFERRFIDELWLFGDKISSGMEAEILLAWRQKIPVVPKTRKTRAALKAFEEARLAYR